MVPAMRIPENIPPKRNTFNRDNLNENRSSKVFSFNRTNHLSVSLCFNLRFFCLLSANVSRYCSANIQRMGYCNGMIKSLCWRVFFICCCVFCRIDHLISDVALAMAAASCYFNVFKSGVLHLFEIIFIFIKWYEQKRYSGQRDPKGNALKNNLWGFVKMHLVDVFPDFFGQQGLYIFMVLDAISDMCCGYLDNGSSHSVYFGVISELVVYFFSSHPRIYV